MVLDTFLINTSTIRYVSRVKWSNPRKGVVSTPRYSSYWKGSLRVALDFGRQLYKFILASVFITPYTTDQGETRDFELRKSWGRLICEINLLATIYENYLGSFRGIMLSELVWQTDVSQFDSHWVTHKLDLDIQLIFVTIFEHFMVSKLV